MPRRHERKRTCTRKRGRMNINDVVRVKSSWQSKLWDRYWGSELHGEKGKIVDIIGHNGQVEGCRVMFPAITISDEDNKEKVIYDFIWPFRKDDAEKVTGKLESTPRKKYRTGKHLQALQSAAQRLRQTGMKIKDIARQLEAPSKTVENWLYR